MSEGGALGATLRSAFLALALQGQARGQAASSSIAQVGGPLAGAPLATLKATRERPLFSPTRRPPSTPSVVAPVTEPTNAAVLDDKPDAPPFTLLGTVIGPGDRRAIFMNEGSKVATRLREGDQDSGWTLVSVGRRSATLRNDGRSVTLELPNTTAAAKAPAGDPDVADAVTGDSAGNDTAATGSGRRLSVAVKARR